MEQTSPIRIDRETFEKLKKRKQETGVTITYMVKKGIELYFKELEKKEK